MQKINDSADENIFTTSDIENIKEVAKFAPFERLSCSLAPSIFGHEYIKKAMLLQLMNGVEKTTQTGMHLRGDIHILLVGDPSTAKSQLLRCVLNVAPLAVSANGRGASGVGLTAAITSDPETRERVLEAGAMVLADRGIVCIDEFDKMDTNDRAALHEVMEQQTVTIQKAGIHTSLNARCSVLAAANPLFGNYSRERSPTENIGFPDSLLSRFDLLFVVLDNMDMASDRVLSEHVLKMHRYNATATKTQLRGTQGVRLEELTAAHDGETTEIFSSEEKLIFGTSATLFSTGFLRKYIEYARRLVQPTLSPACCSVLSDAYSELRSSASLGTLPITARALDSLVRLTEAHARCRLSQVAEECDARVAVEMMRYALYGEKRSLLIILLSHVIFLLCLCVFCLTHYISMFILFNLSYLCSEKLNRYLRQLQRREDEKMTTLMSRKLRQTQHRAATASKMMIQKEAKCKQSHKQKHKVKEAKHKLPEHRTQKRKLRNSCIHCLLSMYLLFVERSEILSRRCSSKKRVSLFWNLWGTEVEVLSRTKQKSCCVRWKEKELSPMTSILFIVTTKKCFPFIRLSFFRFLWCSNLFKCSV